MRYACLIVLFVLARITLSAQEYYNKDSLWTLLKNSEPDTNQVWLYINFGQQFENNDPDSALRLYETALRLSKELNYTRGIISYYTNATYVYNLKARFDTALILNQQAVEIARAFGDSERLAACMNNLGSSYMVLDRYEDAIDAYLQVIPVYERLGNSRYLGTIYENLCTLYFRLSQNEKSIEYGELALKLNRTVNSTYGISSALVNLALPYNEIGQTRKSIDLLNEAYELGKKTNSQYILLIASLNLSDGFADLGDFVRSGRYCEEALVLAKKLDDLESQTIALRGLAGFHLSQNRIDRAEQFAQESLDLALANGMLDHIGKAYTTLSDISISKRDFRASHAYAFKSDSIRTVLLNESIAKNIQELEAKYQTQKKERQIQDLEQASAIKDLTIKKNQLLNYILVGALLSVITIALLARRTYQQKKKLHAKENQIHEARITQLENEKQLMASEAVIKGQEEERGRLAKDLHDGLGGLLSGIKFSLTNMKSNVVLDANNALMFERSLDMLDHSIAELRRVAHNMMPEVLVKFGLAEALRSYCESVKESGIFQVDFQAIDMAERLPTNTEIILYRVIQELLNNAAKHARATHVLVQLSQHDNTVDITVEDNGSGFDTEILKIATGAGWANIRSRIEYLKGKADIQSTVGQGTSIHISIPV